VATTRQKEITSSFQRRGKEKEPEDFGKRRRGVYPIPPPIRKKWDLCAFVDFRKGTGEYVDLFERKGNLDERLANAGGNALLIEKQRNHPKIDIGRKKNPHKGKKGEKKKGLRVISWEESSEGGGRGREAKRLTG